MSLLNSLFIKLAEFVSYFASHARPREGSQRARRVQLSNLVFRVEPIELEREKPPRSGGKRNPGEIAGTLRDAGNVVRPVPPSFCPVNEQLPSALGPVSSPFGELPTTSLFFAHGIQTASRWRFFHAITVQHEEGYGHWPASVVGNARWFLLIRRWFSDFRKVGFTVRRWDG